MLAARHLQTAAAPAKISELVIPGKNSGALGLLMPMLAHLSQTTEGRWLTWIGNGLYFDRNDLLAHSGNTTNLRIIHSRSDEETLWLMWESLHNGTSTHVVGNFEASQSVLEGERAKLEQACQQGNSRALIIKHPAAGF